MSACRCGWNGEGDHPCHWEYQSVKPEDRCPKAGERRLYYNGRPFSLAGMQMKLSVNETFVCDEHWVIFQGMLRERQERLDKANSTSDTAAAMDVAALAAFKIKVPDDR